MRRTRDEAEARVFDYIERFYIPLRRHFPLDYFTPAIFEEPAALDQMRVHEITSSRDCWLWAHKSAQRAESIDRNVHVQLAAGAVAYAEPHRAGNVAQHCGSSCAHLVKIRTVNANRIHRAQRVGQAGEKVNFVLHSYPA